MRAFAPPPNKATAFASSAFSADGKEEIRPEYKKMMSDFNELYSLVHPMIMKHYEECGTPKSSKFNHFAFPPEITKAFGDLPMEGSSNEEVAKSIETAFKYSVKTMHPFFLDKLYSGSDPIGQMAELVSTVINPAVHVYHVSPVFSVMEVEVIKHYAAAFGFDPEKCDGTLNPGGTMGNMMALLAARQEHFPHVRLDGWNGTEKPVAFTPAQSHYSIKRGAMVSGMGMKNMREVPCERWTGQMDTYALEQMIIAEKEKGNHPFFVNCMAGSTVMGAFDKQNEIADIAKKHGMWHHIDGCWGGFLAWSDKHKERLFAGTERADSITMNCHKGQGVPNQATMLLVNDKGNILKKTNTSGAEYLFHESEYSRYDIGDKTLSCGRKGDGLKIWLSIKKHGINGFKKYADDALDKSEYITNQLKAQPDKFVMENEPMGTNICFTYIPPAFRAEGVDYTFEQKGSVHKIIFDRMNKEGTLLIQQQPLNDGVNVLPSFFRLTLKSEKTSFEDMDYILEEIDRLGQDLTPETPIMH